MQTEFGFRIFTEEELFIDKLNKLYLELFPRCIEHFTYSLHFSDKLEVDRSEDVTQVNITATDTICAISLPEISFSIIPEQENEGWLIIQATLNPYHSFIVDYEFEKFVSDVAAEFIEATITYITASVNLVEKTPTEYRGEKIGVVATRVGVHPKTLLRMIEIEQKYVPIELTQKAIGNKWGVSARTIRTYIRNMKSYSDYFPNTIARFGESAD